MNALQYLNLFSEKQKCEALSINYKESKLAIDGKRKAHSDNYASNVLEYKVCAGRYKYPLCCFYWLDISIVIHLPL